MPQRQAVEGAMDGKGITASVMLGWSATVSKRSLWSRTLGILKKNNALYRSWISSSFT